MCRMSVIMYIPYGYMCTLGDYTCIHEYVLTQFCVGGYGHMYAALCRCEAICACVWESCVC